MGGKTVRAWSLRNGIAGAAMLVLLGTSAPAQTNPGATRQLQEHLEMLDAKLEASIVARDADALDALYADDFERVHAGARRVDTRSDILYRMRNGTLPVSVSRKQHGVVVRLVSADVALVSGITEVVNAPAKGRPSTRDRFHVLRVYVLAADGWRVTSQHVTWAIADDAAMSDVSHRLAEIVGGA